MTRNPLTRPNQQREGPQPRPSGAQRQAAAGCRAGAPPACASPDCASPASRARSPARVGAGISAAATITTRNATTRIATVIASDPSGSPKTTTPAGIDDALPAIDVTAITATPSPICSDRAEAKNATMPQATIRYGNGVCEDREPAALGVVR